MRLQPAPSSSVLGRSGRSLCIAPFAAANKTTSGKQTSSGKQTVSGRQTASGRQTTSSKTISSRQTFGKGRTEEVQFERPSRTRSSKTASQEDEVEEKKPNAVAVLAADVQAKWQFIASRPQLVAASGATVGGLALTGAVLAVVNEVPVVPKVLELAGLVYVAAFVYTYLLQAKGRQQLAKGLLKLKDRASQLVDGEAAQ